MNCFQIIIVFFFGFIHSAQSLFFDFFYCELACFIIHIGRMAVIITDEREENVVISICIV